MKTLAAMFVLMLVAGCATLDGRSTVSNANIVALGDGIADQDAMRTLGRTDRTKALAAEFRALETTEVGQTVSWKSGRPGISGEVFAGQPYSVGSQYCRQISHTIDISGEITTGRGTACKNENGTWAPIL